MELLPDGKLLVEAAAGVDGVEEKAAPSREKAQATGFIRWFVFNLATLGPLAGRNLTPLLGPFAAFLASYVAAAVQCIASVEWMIKVKFADQSSERKTGTVMLAVPHSVVAQGAFEQQACSLLSRNTWT